MRKVVVTCDRCGGTIGYDESNDKLISGDTFIIPTISSTGNVVTQAYQVDLCWNCIHDLKQFMSYLR